MSPVQAVARRLAIPRVAAPTVRGAHLAVVDDTTSPLPRRHGRRGTVTIAVVFVAMLALAASHAVLVQGQVTLDGLDEAVAAQQGEYHRARLEVARLEAPERIMNEAIIRLGMVEPQDVVYLTPTEAETTVDRLETDDVDKTWLAIKPYLERSS